MVEQARQPGPTTKITIVHLSGRRRGKVDVFARPRITVGSGPWRDLRFSPRHHPQVAHFHAEIRFENCEY
ncbi:MAG: hypothetical protein HYY85_14935, partial [Deltaproteobacteria bacterium]|nr:hypothetical protein [Deltaproteobacteria bacterium]